jgi:maltokinase
MLADAGPGTLVPPRREGTVEPVLREVRDVVELPSGGVIAVVDTDAGVVVVPLVVETVGVRRAAAGDGVWADLLEAMVRGRDLGRLRCAPLAPDLGEPVATGGERAIDVDQSNDSVAVGERAVVKLSTHTGPGPHAGVQLLAHLSLVGFTDIPRPQGVATWSGEGLDDVLVATASAWLPGARDGWTWYPAMLERWLDGAPCDPDEIPAILGALVGRLHVALATPSPVLPDPVGTAGPETLAAWRETASAQLTEALRLTDGEEGARLRERAGRIAGTLEAFDEIGSTPTMRIHGDLHVGQLLRWAGGFAVIDLDGNPVSPPAERLAPASPVRDVASMLRAIDHVGRVVQHRRPGAPAAPIERWIGASRAAFLDAYLAELGTRGHAGLFDVRLLAGFEAAGECHEFVYAARFLPAWRGVPDLALQAMFP